MTEELAEADGLAKPEGVDVVWVEPGSPADQAKLRIGDIIQRVSGRYFNGEELSRDIDSVRRLRRVVEASEIGAPLTFQILRDGVKMSVVVATIERESDPDNRWLVDAVPAVRALRPDLGLTTETITDVLRAKFGIPATINGVVVTDVKVNTMGFDLGIKPGNVIVRINGTDIDSHATLQAAVQKARADGHQFMKALILDTVGMRWIGVPVPPAA
jgi:serine protease Do